MTTPKQTPLGVNVQSSLLQNAGFEINPVASAFIGSSTTNSDYTPGTVVSATCLNLLTYAINDAYVRGNVTTGTYDDLISIGSSVCEALGNAKPPTYDAVDPSGLWTTAGTPATTGFANEVNPDYPNNDIGQGQEASWLPYDTTNVNKSVTQWGFVRNYALQAWNEFNWNGIPDDLSMPEYKDFLGSFMASQSYIDLNNTSIQSMTESTSFLKGTYSNMNDLSSADITGVNLATLQFGQDLITSGKVIDLSKIDKFGLPSVLFQTIKKFNATSQSLTLALLSAGLTPAEIDGISSGRISSVSKQQEQQIFGAFLVIVGVDLIDILVPLNCKTKGLSTLADLLDVKKLFPNSYQSLTVPVYNTTAGPTNSKTYYPIFEGQGVSPRLISPTISTQIGTAIPTGTPQIGVAPATYTVQGDTSILDESSRVINGRGV